MGPDAQPSWKRFGAQQQMRARRRERFRNSEVAESGVDALFRAPRLRSTGPYRQQSKSRRIVPKRHQLPL